MASSLSAGQVRLLQTNLNERLRAHGRKAIAVDGRYGAETRKAVHLTKYLLGFPTARLDTGPSWWFRKVVGHPALRPAAYRARASARAAFLAKHPAVAGAASRKGAFGLDWAWGTPNLAVMRKAGVRFAARYLSHDPAKDLDPAEARALEAAGIDIVVVWESTANRAIRGRNAGVADATFARQKAKACGIPADRPIYFAVDFDTSAAQVAEYFRGAASVLGRNRVGVYGGVRIIDGLVGGPSVRWGWQTYAWSAGRVSAKAHLYQYSNGHQLAGVSCDYNKALADDFGQWRP